MGINAGAVAIALLAADAAAAGPSPLRLCYEDVPQAPWTMPDGTGLNIDLLRKVEQRLNEQFAYLPMPWKRCIKEVRSGDVDAVIGSVDSPERRDEGVLPTLADGRADSAAALYSESYHVFLRVNSGASWDGKHFVVPQGGIIVPSGYFMVAALRAKGYVVDDSIKSSADGLRLLTSGAGDVALLFGAESEALATQPRFKDKVIESPVPYVTVPFYLLVSHTSYARDPSRFKAIWNGIRQERDSDDYKKRERAALQAKKLPDGSRRCEIPGAGGICTRSSAATPGTGSS